MDSRFVRLAALLAVLSGCGSSEPDAAASLDDVLGRTVTLQSAETRAFLSARPDGASKLMDGGESCETVFLLADFGNGKTGLRSLDGLWLSAEDNGAVNVNRDGRFGWETFDIAMPEPGSFTLRSYHATYLAVVDGTVGQAPGETAPAEAVWTIRPAIESIVSSCG